MTNLNEEQKKWFQYMSLEGELWVEHKDFPDYRISNKDRVVSLKYNPLLVSTQENKGCIRATLMNKDGEIKTRSVRKLFREGV